ncbi:MAG: carbohydrate-binding protein [Ruminococcus flavefaciens]|nr:carbohydrate-binding protein [Ruminococcus flavefaciens]MCM1361435.1 carbohydrate-binding protein [Clostridiales bacterium]MCM1435904.1 carbohydrate-binding protein [Ruminococcus flavefaciens]
MKKKFLKSTACALCAALSVSSFPAVQYMNIAAADEEYFVVGDVINNDGVTNEDALAIQKHLLELEFIEDEKAYAAADANCDGKIDMSDAVSIMIWNTTARKSLYVGELHKLSTGKDVVIDPAETDLINAGSQNGYTDFSKAESSSSFGFIAHQDGNYKFRIKYRSSSDCEMRLILNNSDVYTKVQFEKTDDEDGEVIVAVRIAEGDVNVILDAPDGGAEIASIDICVGSNNPDDVYPLDKPPVTSPATTTTTTTMTTTSETTTTTTTTTTTVPVKERYYAVEADYYKGIRENTNAGFAGEAYVNYDNLIGSYVEWTVDAPADGNYEVNFRYANGTDANRQVKVITNGDKEYGEYVDFEGTGSWTEWSDKKTVVSLKKGKNTIKAYAVTANGGPNMDYIEIISTDKSAPHNKATSGKRVENLDRGVSSAHAKNGNLVSWRLLATDNENTTFDLWKNGQEKLATFTADQATNYFDNGGLATDWYTIDVYVDGECTEFAQGSINYTNTNSGQSGAYFDIPTQKPADMTMPDGTVCTYTENDCSVGDADGDGQYEIFVKWDPSNSQDNSKDGYTGNVFIDCYKLDGTLLWRVDLGKNIRAGAHYTQFMVYDFDGDGKSELICKTADGTKDGQGNYVGDPSKDYRSAAGRILEGPEYLTLFDGETGKALDTIDYKPARGNYNDWGDNYGNRVDRFTACVAYLDGQRPSAVFGRGYYTRAAVTAYNVENGKLKEYWAWDTGFNVSAKGYGDGNHHILGADVDGDGKDEIVVGSAVIDDNGELLYTSGLAHGDAIHIGDFDPTNPGLEIFQCLEDEKHPNGTEVNFGVILRDGKTGKTLFRETAGGDTGRAIADNLIAGNGGAEMVGSHSADVHLASGTHDVVCQWSDITKWGQNSVVYWTDVLERAVLDRTMADQYGKGRVFTGDGVSYNNASKSNACLTCDLTGDWREEMIFRKSDGTGLRVFTTTYTTQYNLYSLMHNPQYRIQVAAQNNGYNQPPHTDYYIDSEEYVRPEEPDVWSID